MPIVRDKKTGKFVKGNSYWLNKKNKKANSGSFEKGSIPWNKGNKTYKNCEFCGKKFSTNKKKLTKPEILFKKMF